MFCIIFSVILHRLWQKNFEGILGRLSSSALWHIKIIYKDFDCTYGFENFRITLIAKLLWAITLIALGSLFIYLKLPRIIVMLPIFYFLLVSVSNTFIYSNMKKQYKKEMSYEMQKFALPVLKANKIVTIYQWILYAIVYLTISIQS